MEGNLTKFIKPMHPSIIWRVLCIFIIMVSVFKYFIVSKTTRNFNQTEFVGQVISTVKNYGQINQFYVEVEQNIKIKITTTLREKISFGDKLFIICPNYKSLINYGAQGECAWPKIEKLVVNNRRLINFFQKLRQQAYEYLESYLVEPYLSLTAGLLWGDDTNLSSAVKKDFQKTGVTHILAASGYNLMVLSSLLFYLLVYVGFYRKQAAGVVMLCVVAFTFLAGLEPAVIRASIMIGVMIIARSIGQKNDALNLLLSTAAMMLLVSPSLIASIGFQLSFMAMVGLMFILPPLKNILLKWPDYWGIKEIITQTLAANLATWPIIVWHFEKLSIISPVANVVVSPVVNLSFIMAGPIFVLFLFNDLAQIVAWLWQTCLIWLTQTINWLAKLPGAEIRVSKTASLMLSPVYLFIIWLIIKYEKKLQK